MKLTIILMGGFLCMLFAESIALSKEKADEGSLKTSDFEAENLKRYKRGLKKFLKKILSNDDKNKSNYKESESRHKPRAPPMNPGLEAELTRLALLPDKTPMLGLLSQVADGWTSSLSLATLCQCKNHYCDCCATSPFKGPGCLTLEANLRSREVDIFVFKENLKRARRTTTIHIAGGKEICMNIFPPIKMCLVPLSTQAFGHGGIEGCFIMRIAYIAKTLCLRYQPGMNAYVINMI